MTTAGSKTDQTITLLLLLSRTKFTDDERALAETGCCSLADWKLFTDLAIRHGVAALIWQNMTDLGLTGTVPEAERILLDGIRFKTIARVSFITAAASEIVTTLEHEGIRALLLKGLALEHLVYGSRGLRQMSDADLLVAPEEALRARDILVTAGFTSSPAKSPLYRHILLDIGNHLPELHRSGLSVDLHHRLFGPKGSEIVSRAIEEPAVIEAGGRTFYGLPPQVAFLGLVSHISKHEQKGEFQLRLYTDIYLLLKKHESEIVNEKLLSLADQAGLSEEVRIVLTFLSHVYGVEIPKEFSALPGSEKKREEVFFDYLRHPGLLKPQSQREIYQENLRSLKGIRRKIIFITGDLFPSIEFMKKRYGCHSVLPALLLYPHRAGKLIWIFDLILAKIRDK